MKTKTLVVIAVLLAGVIAGFLALAPKGGRTEADNPPAPAVHLPAGGGVPVTGDAGGAAADAETAGDVAPASIVPDSESLPAAAPQPESFAVPPVDLDLSTGDAPPGDAVPAAPQP